MPHLKKLAFIPALIGAIVLTNGCGGDSHHYESLNAQISGRAMKGILANADCIVTTMTGVELFNSTSGDEPCTNDNGRYNITLTAEDTSQLIHPIQVEIQARSTETTYKCDIPDGCEGKTFGQSVPITDTTFSLKSIVPSIRHNSTQTVSRINVTPFTNMAASRARALSSTPSADQVDLALRETAGVLNNILGIESDEDTFDGNFFQLDVADITDPVNDDLDDSDSKLGTLLSLASASVIGLVDSNSSTNNSVSKVVSNLAAAFEDGKINVNSTAANIDAAEQTATGIDLTSIVTQIEETVTEITNAYTATGGSNASQLISKLNSNLSGGESSDSTVLTSVTNAVTATRVAKENVVDADNDPTEPEVVPPDGESDDDDDDATGGSGSSGGGSL